MKVTIRSKATGVFFLKLTALFTTWFICYNLLLKPTRIIDRPLTNSITSLVVKAINIVSPHAALAWRENNNPNGTYLVKDNKSVLIIADICNGIDLIFIYACVILLLPHSLKRKFAFLAGGILVIFLVNVLRISCLYFIYVSFRSNFDFSHHYLFTLIMYFLIFCGWILYIKKPGADAKAA